MTALTLVRKLIDNTDGTVSAEVVAVPPEHVGRLTERANMRPMASCSHHHRTGRAAMDCGERMSKAIVRRQKEARA